MATAQSDHEDAQWLAAWRDGDLAAGKRLFARYYDPVARFFLNKVGDAGGDLIQRTFLACLEGLPRFRGDGTFRSYIFAIAYRQLCRHYRERRGDRLDPEHESAVALDPSISVLLGEREEMRLFLAGLRQIPLDMQVTLELHYLEECSVAEIATTLEIPVGTVKSRLHRGRELLRAAIERLSQRADLVASTIDGLATWARLVRERAGLPPV